MKAIIKYIIIGVLSLIIPDLYSQNNSYFTYLNKVKIDTSFNIVFGYDKSNTRLINKPCYELDKNDPFYCNTEEIPVFGILVAKFKNENFEDSLYIIYDQGLSADPSFVISTDRAINDKLEVFECLELYLTSTGKIYTAGHTNNMFNNRRKFQIKQNSIVEIKQPYLYVGIKGKTISPVILYGDRNGNSIIANLPENYEIEVLLAENIIDDLNLENIYLVRTSFGLVGWLRYKGYGKGIIKGLYFAGD